MIAYAGNYDYYLEKKEALEQIYLSADDTAAPKEEASTEAKLNWQSQKELSAKLRKKENDLKMCEEEISGLEQQLADLEAKMQLPQIATDVAKLQELTKSQASLQEKLSDLYNLWETLAE
jgi:ATP-binding cassette subfamily F protein 3